MTLQQIEALAADARCISDDDWGTDRQIAAENKLFHALTAVLTPDEFAQLENYCLKATTDEMVDEALRLVRRVLT